MDEKTIQRIKKLQALAERGVGGEKTTAQKKLAKLLKDKQRHCTTFCMDTGTPPEMQPRGYGIFRRRHMGRYLP